MARSHFVVFWWKIHGRLMESMEYTPEILEPKHEGLEDCCPFQIDDFPGCSPWFISICQSNLLPIFWCLLFCFSWHPVLYWQVKQYRTLKRFMMVVIIEKNQIAAKVWVCDDCLQNSCEHIYYSIFYWDLEKTRSNLNINNIFFVLCVILEGSIWFLWKV